MYSVCCSDWSLLFLAVCVRSHIFTLWMTLECLWECHLSPYYCTTPLLPNYNHIHGWDDAFLPAYVMHLADVIVLQLGEQNHMDQHWRMYSTKTASDEIIKIMHPKIDHRLVPGRDGVQTGRLKHLSVSETGSKTRLILLNGAMRQAAVVWTLNSSFSLVEGQTVVNSGVGDLL